MHTLKTPTRSQDRTKLLSNWTKETKVAHERQGRGPSPTGRETCIRASGVIKYSAGIAPAGQRTSTLEIWKVAATRTIALSCRNRSPRWATPRAVRFSRDRSERTRPRLSSSFPRNGEEAILAWNHPTTRSPSRSRPDAKQTSRQAKNAVRPVPSERSPCCSPH